MKIIKTFSLLLILCAVTAIFVLAQDSPSNIVKHDLSQAEIDKILSHMTAREAEFRKALDSYAFTRNAVIQTVGMGGQVTGEYRRDSFMTFKPDGSRIEKVLFAPIPTLTEISVSTQDLEDLGGVNPFALEPSAIGLYNFTYLGKERIDELDLYVFDVAPKVMPDPKKSKQRVFTGRIWVDDKDFDIVRSKGRAGPESKKEKFPIVETWRQNVDGKYWFPTYATSNDELVWDSGQVVRFRMRVKYSNYNVGSSTIKIIDDPDEGKDEKPTPSPTPTPKKP